MNRHLAWVFAALMTSSLAAGTSCAVEMNLMTGREKGTYYQFGLNLQQLVKPRGIELGVQPSTGSIENLYAVYQRPNTQVGIVQSDVLAFVTRVQSNPMLARIAQKTRLVFPLYNEEVHILGRKGIADFDGLQGKRVAVGEDGSGTYLTARLLLEVTQVKPSQMVTVGTDDALAKLKAGEIDAMFYVAGIPVKLFNDGVSEADGLALVPISNPKASEFYQQITIPVKTYPWQKGDVTSVAVKAVLVSYDFRNAHCDSVGQLAKILYENLAWLRQNGHPKWKSVDLNYPLRGWEQYDCVKRYLVKTSPVAPQPRPAELPAGGINPVMDAVKEMLNP